MKKSCGCCRSTMRLPVERLAGLEELRRAAFGNVPVSSEFIIISEIRPPQSVVLDVEHVPVARLDALPAGRSALPVEGEPRDAEVHHVPLRHLHRRHRGRPEPCPSSAPCRIERGCGPKVPPGANRPRSETVLPASAARPPVRRRRGRRVVPLMLGTARRRRKPAEAREKQIALPQGHSPPLRRRPPPRRPHHAERPDSRRELEPTDGGRDAGGRARKRTRNGCVADHGIGCFA